jgi:hypothetical protein
MANVVIYRSDSGQHFTVINVPDSYTTGGGRPAADESDRHHETKAAAEQDARARLGGRASPLDESHMDLRSGDVVIRLKPGTSICAWGTVLDSRVMPTSWQTGTIAEVRSSAIQTVATTQGYVHEVLEDPAP